MRRLRMMLATCEGVEAISRDRKLGG